MKKIIKTNVPEIFFVALTSTLVGLFISFCPAELAKRCGDDFYATLSVSLPIGILCFISLWIALFYKIVQESKLKKAIIKKYSLIEHEYIEVIVSDSSLFPLESKIIIEAIKAINNGIFNVSIPININDETLTIPFDNITPTSYTLIKIFKKYGGKFYLHFDSDYNIFLSLKDVEDNLLSTTKIHYNTVLSQVLNGFSPIS